MRKRSAATPVTKNKSEITHVDLTVQLLARVTTLEDQVFVELKADVKDLEKRIAELKSKITGAAKNVRKRKKV